MLTWHWLSRMSSTVPSRSCATTPRTLGQTGSALRAISGDASPLAVTSRNAANKMLGGEKGLQQIIQRAKSKNIKVIVDSVARVCSSRHHRKYKDLLLHYLDEDGKRNICYGTDGQAQKFTDTAMLNYRKVESWDLLIDEII